MKNIDEKLILAPNFNTNHWTLNQQQCVPLGSIVILLGSYYARSVGVFTFPFCFFFSSFPIFFRLSDSRSRNFFFGLTTQIYCMLVHFRMWFSAGYHSEILLASNGSCQHLKYNVLLFSSDLLSTPKL